MSAVFKVFLLLAVLFCISEAQMDRSGSSCLCSNVTNRLNNRNHKMKGIELHVESNSCPKIEIIVTMTDNSMHCLNPLSPEVQRLLNVLKKKTRTSSH